VRLDATDIVTYTPDNKITLDMGRWFSQSTRAAIRAVTGVDTHKQHSRTWVKDRDAKWYQFKNGMQLQAGDYYCNHKIIDPVYPETHTLKRKELNAKLKQFKNYYNYLLGVTKVDGWQGMAAVVMEPNYSALTNPDNYKDGVFAPEPEAAFALGARILGNATFSGRRSYWKFFVDHHNPNFNPIAGLDLEKIISTALKRAIIKTHKDELLTKSTVTSGEIVKDPYAWV